MEKILYEYLKSIKFDCSHDKKQLKIINSDAKYIYFEIPIYFFINKELCKNIQLN